MVLVNKVQMLESPLAGEVVVSRSFVKSMILWMKADGTQEESFKAIV